MLCRKYATLCLGSPPQTERFLEWANILHDEIMCCVVLCKKNPGVFTVQIVFQQNCENYVLSPFDYLR